jgi:hypothetical protein
VARYSVAAGRADRKAPDQVTYYQLKADRARRTLRGIDEQIANLRRPSPARSRSSPNSSSAAKQLFQIERALRKGVGLD